MRTEEIGMKPIKLATVGLIAAAGMFGALAATASPAPAPLPEVNSSLVTPVYYCCWWSYWYKKCSNYCGANKYYAYYAQRYYRPRYRYNY